MDTHSGANPSGSPPAIHTVAANGCYGTVLWTPHKELWDILPVPQRIVALDTAARVIDPFFVKVAENMLKRLGIAGISAKSLSAEWSLETIEDAQHEGCRAGPICNTSRRNYYTG